MDIMHMRRWIYLDEIPPDVNPGIDLLVRYTGVKREEIEFHIRAIREQAWQCYRNPTIGRWRFLRLADSKSPHYHHAIGRLKNARSHDVLLDLGCGMGQVVRQILDDGAAPSRVFGLDNQSRLIELGLRLFGDADILGHQFVVGDMLGEVQNLLQLNSAVTLVHATSFWHLFGWDQQVHIARRLVEFMLRPCESGGTGEDAMGAVIFGEQAGSVRPGEGGDWQSASYLHNQASFQRLWDEVGQATNTKWIVSLQLVEETLDSIPGVSKDVRSTTYGVYQTK